MAVDIGNLPIVIGDMLGISELAGGIFACLVLFLVTIIPVLLVMKDSPKAFPVLITVDGLLITGFGVAIGWLGIWFLLLMFLGLAVVLAFVATDKVGG